MDGGVQEPLPGGHQAGPRHPPAAHLLPSFPESLGDSCTALLCFRPTSRELVGRAGRGGDPRFPLWSKLVEPQEGMGGSSSDLCPKSGLGNGRDRRDVLGRKPAAAFAPSGPKGVC